MKKYYEIGGTLTGVILDLEYVGLSSYSLSQDMVTDPLLMQKIVEDPHYETEVRPLLEERGFEFWPNPNEYAPEIYSAHQKSGDDHEKDRAIWDKAMQIRLNRYQEESCCDPVWTYFPDALINDYQSADIYSWSQMPNSDGSSSWVAGNRTCVGNVSNFSSYHSRPYSDLYYVKGSVYEYRNPPTYVETIYKDTPFNMLKWEHNLFKTMYLDSHTNMISACLAAYDYNSSRKNGIANTAYYPENIFHLGLLDPKPFRLYVYHKEYDSTEEYYERLSVINEVMVELTRIVGYSDREPIVLPRNWNDSFVLSGMYAGGRNIWRITPDTSTGVTKESFLVDNGENPTFYINGQTIVFPGGKIIEDSVISQTGTCGYWVETESDVVPIVTNITDRYEQYPAYIEDYEAFEAGATYTIMDMPYANTWTITPSKGATSLVQADANGNKVLALTGDVKLYLAGLTANVTAADSYAKRQSWELTFTLPETIPDEAELVLLNFEGKKIKDKDGGLKIAGGKVYYTNVVEVEEKLTTEYKELENVTLAAGGTYTLKRVVDFQNAEAYTSSYYIYDVAGECVGKVEDVPMLAVTLPVQKIGFSTKGFGENTVCFDNFKLRTIGFAADLTLYEAEFGMEYDDITAAYSGKTGYRYSWMNASDKEEKAQIVAQVLDEEGNVVSETVIKELTMAPGYDGFETGIYDAGDQAVVFTVKTITAAEGGISLWLYAGIGAAVVLIAIAAALIVVSKKKKPQAPAAE